MASIKFYPNLKKGKSKIYVRVTIRRGLDFRLSTTQTIIEALHWNHTTGYPKKNNAKNKELYETLFGLEKKIDDQITDIEKSTELSSIDISSKWLKEIILEHFNEQPVTDKDLLIPFAENYANSLYNKTYVRNGRRIKYTQNTINKYLSFAKRLKEFQDYINKPIKILEVNDRFANTFLSYYTDINYRAVNTRGRYVKRLKTLVKEAEIDGRKVDIKYKNIKGFEDETIVTFLTFDELEQIIDTPMPNQRLTIAKHWLIIGCFTAQRISDLFRMNKTMFVKKNNRTYISLKQFKTKKNVFIPVFHHVESVLNLYNNDFPPNISENEQSNRSALSNLMKEVCKHSGIKENVKGRFNGKVGIYPKYKLIQNHSCRRSFASNFYGMKDWTNQMIMEITGHETEKSFLKYIDKDNFYLSERAGDNFEKMKEEYLNKSKLKKI